MGLVRNADLSIDPIVFPPSGAHFIYSKAGGIFAMDSTGTVVGPFTGGSGPPTGPAGGSLSGTYPNPGIAPGAVGSAELAPFSVIAGLIGPLAVGTTELADGSVTTIKLANDAVQTAKIANSAVTGPKIADATIGPAKLQNPVGADKLVYSDSATTWAYGYAPRLRFGTDLSGPFVARISVLGDRGTSTDPLNPRILNSSAADADLGYLARDLAYEAKVSIDLATLVNSPPTSINCTNLILINISLPDARTYPRGQEIVFNVDSTSAPVIIPVVGSAPPYTSIIGPTPVVAQALLPGTNCRFIAFGDGWRLSGTSANRLTTKLVLPIADGVSERPLINQVPPNNRYGWILTAGAIGREWQSDLFNRYLFFPIDLPSGSTITRIDVLLTHNTPAPVTPMQVRFGGSAGLDFTVPSIGVNSVTATANALANNVLQVVSLTGLTTQIDTSEEFWTVGITSSSGAAPGTEDEVFGVLVTYYPL